MSMRTIVTCTLSIALVLLPCSAKEREREFNPRQVIPPIRPITDARISKPAVAKNPVGDSDLVIGLTVGGAARAYPINMLTGPRREIINDKLGGRSIAATW